MHLGQKILQLRKLLASGNLAKAKKRVVQLYKDYPDNEQILKAGVLVFAKLNDLKNAIFFADKLLIRDPANFGYVTNLANWCLSLNKKERAIGYYQNFVDHYPGNARAYFQLGLLYQQKLEYTPAVDMFEQAIESGFMPLEECYVNLALSHSEFRKEALAIDCLLAALKHNPLHVIASLNLATLYQAAGRKTEAEDTYQKILQQDPNFSEARIRLIYSMKIDADDSLLIEAASNRSQSPTVPALEKEGLNYALGKAKDDLENYEAAFAYYRIANGLQAVRIGNYEGGEMEKLVRLSMSYTDSEWVARAVDNTDFAPIFIVGHFRSGSSLVEQILSGHSAICALGEVDYFLRKSNEHAGIFQSLRESENDSELREMSVEYRKLTSTMSGGYSRITDKRPENLVFMGMIKKMFPLAKFIHTRRNLLDNGVSVYFQQLNDLSRFSTSLESFAQYDVQCQKLMTHWRSIFAESIYEIAYEDMVNDPQKYSAELIDFLGLDWESDCLNFEKRENFIRTASVSQVREKIYTTSVGRGRNYYPFFTSSEQNQYSDHL